MKDTSRDVMKDLQTDLDKYTTQWEKALKDGVFDDAPHLPKPRLVQDLDFFGQYPTADEDAPLNECDTKYWNKVYRLSSNLGEAPDPLTEEKKPTEAEIKDVSARMAGTHNPVYPDSLGPDGKVVPTPNWTDGPELNELSELKISLEKLESKLNTAEANNENGKALQGKIDALKQKIDELSDALNGHRFTNDNLKV